MSFLVRKITRSKWNDTASRSVEDFCADIFADIRTSNDALSVWEIEDESKLDSAILALAASKTTRKIEKINYVLIPKEEVEESFEIGSETEGDVIVPDLRNMHRDLCGLKYKDLGALAKIVAEKLKDDKLSGVYTKKQVKGLLKSAYDAKRIDMSLCTNDILQDLLKL